MKRLYILLFAVMLGSAINAETITIQSDHVDRYFQYFLAWKKYSAPKIAEQKLRSRTMTKEIYDKKGQAKKTLLVTQEFFTPEGYLTEVRRYNDNGKLVATEKYTIGEKGQLLSVYVSSTTYLWQEYSYTYFNDTLIASGTWKRQRRHGLKKNRVLISGKTITYTTDNRLETVQYLHANKPTSSLKYTYYPNGDKRSVIYYDKKGKITQTYNYDCGLESSLLSKKQKDTVTTCNKNETLPDGSTLTINETMDEKGKIVRSLYTVSADKKFNKTEHFDHRNRKTFQYEYLQKSDSLYIQEWKFMNKRGKIHHDEKAEHYYSKTSLYSLSYVYEKEKLKYVYRYSYSTYE